LNYKNTKTPYIHYIEPTKYIKLYISMTLESKKSASRNYNKVGVIYAWKNKINNRFYVGHTKNLAFCLRDYSSNAYLFLYKKGSLICAS